MTKNMKLDYTFDRQLELEREDAREEGREEGLQEGQQLLNQLITLLLADGRTEDLKKSASDREYQLRLLKEYGLVQRKQCENGQEWRVICIQN